MISFQRMLVSMALLAVPLFSSAQQKDVYARNGLTLNFISEDATLNPKVKERMIDAFFGVYPKLIDNFNPDAVREVIFFVDTAYTGVAEAYGPNVRFSDDWLRMYPEDIDVVTHEVMHIVQSYPGDAGPWWVTEGIADYARHVYGVNNSKAGWALSPYQPGQFYDNGYRVTGSFFLWIENKKPGFVKALDHAMRTHTYTDAIWKTQTGKSIDELWSDYARKTPDTKVEASKGAGRSGR